KLVFLAAPLLVFVPPMMAFAVIPWGEGMAPMDMNIGVFYVLAVGSLSTIIFWMGGWSSYNKYSLVGGMRVVAQMVSYELPLVLALLGVIMLTGTLNINEIVNAQKGSWFILAQPLAFLIYFIAGISETNRTPFDLVEGESEIIAGPYTEYGGMGYAMFMLAEYGGMMVISCMATIMFLGGWLAPFGWTFLPSWFWFFIKVYALIFVFMWLRWTYPRIRVDQLMGFGWKVLVPLSLANIFITGIGMYIYRAIGW
ncbi:MAG TPA: NADH-quinone oxidoreductase subunit H, partial [Desulfotomaculum sp.]|nr:NADH-quinone oxidoreductase subunit H [Desulfotomaculum sp.]